MLNELSEVNMMNVLDHQFDENWWMEYRAGNILDQTDLDYVIHRDNQKNPETDRLPGFERF